MSFFFFVSIFSKTDRGLQRNIINLILTLIEKRPRPGDPPRIERDDFPAPPYPYTDPERRRRWSETSRRISVSETSDVDGHKRQQVENDENDPTPDDPKVKVVLKLN